MVYVGSKKWTYNADTHVAEPDVLGGNLLVDAAGKDDVLLAQARQDLRDLDRLRQVDGGHAVRLVLGVRGDLLEAQLGDGGLDLVGRLLVLGEPLGQGHGEDLVEGRVQGVHELGGRRREVGRLLGFVVSHDRQPVLDGRKVRGRRRLAVLDGLDGTAAEEGNGQTGGDANGLLAGGDDTVQLPVVKSNLLAGDGAHAVNNDEGLRRDTVHELRQVAQLAQDAGRGVDVRDGQQLVVLGLEGGLDLGELGAAADGGLELGDVGAVDAEGVSEAVAKVAGAEDEGGVALLDQVGTDDVPTQGAGAGDDERLGGRVGGLEELAQAREDIAEDGNKRGADMALAERLEWCCYKLNE